MGRVSFYNDDGIPGWHVAGSPRVFNLFAERLGLPFLPAADPLTVETEVFERRLPGM